MKSIKLSLLLMVLTISVFACKKETETPAPSPTSTPTKTEILTSGKWLPSTAILTPPVDLNGTMVSNVTPYIKECELDNYYTFSKSKTYLFSNGALKCDSNENAINSRGTWFLTNDESYFVLNNDNGTDSLSLVFFSKDSLIYKINTTYDGNVHELKRTLIKK